MARRPKQDKKLIAELYERYAYALEYWSPIHKEGNMDVRFIAGDPWDPRDIQARDNPEQKRPHLVFDEGSQYVNQFVGQSMQQERAVRVEPTDERVNGKTAEVMQGRVQQIDYASRGQTHTAKGLSDCAKRGYGWISLRTCYSSDEGREQEPCYNPVPNPDSRLGDPDMKQIDGSDMDWCFVRDQVKKSYVKKKWSFAKNLGPQNQYTVTLVEYWKVDKKVIDQTLWLDDPNHTGGIEIKKSALPEGSTVTDDQVTLGSGETAYTVDILDSRDIEERKVTKYICQIVDPTGPPQQQAADVALDVVEILEVEEWNGKWIPEIPVLGPKEFINNGGTVTVTLLSMLRRARDPMQLLNLTGTCAAELVSMTPKTHAVGYEGQFENHEDEWNNIGSSPLGYLQVKPIVDPTTNQVLPLPELMEWEPPIQAVMILWNACKDAIRSAVGQLASPELDKGKSGIAIQKIQTEGASAVYHITEAYTRSLEQVGRVMGDLIEKTHDTKRNIPIRKNDGTQKMVTINAPYHEFPAMLTHQNGSTMTAKSEAEMDAGMKQGYMPPKEKSFHPIEVGAFNYTISTGPSYQSQQEQSSDFVDKLIQSVPELLVNGQGQTTFGDLFVQLKNLGPTGDVIVERFKKMLKPGLEDTPLDIPPQVQAELQKGQQVINALVGKVNELQQVLQGKYMERASEDERNKRDNETKALVATINNAAKLDLSKLESSMDLIAEHLNRQFDLMMAKMEQSQLPAGNGGSASTSSDQGAAAPTPPSTAGDMATSPGPPQPTHVFNPQAGEIQPVGQ